MNADVLTTARFESPRDLHDRRALGAAGRPACRRMRLARRRRRGGRSRRPARPAGPHPPCCTVPVTLLLTQHNDERRPDRGEATQYLTHPRYALAIVRAGRAHRGQRAPDDLRGDPRRTAARDHDGVCGAGMATIGGRILPTSTTSSRAAVSLRGVYREQIGLVSTPLSRRSTGRPSRAGRVPRLRDLRQPVATKGLFLFARLADMLGARRPDIPCWSCSPDDRWRPEHDSRDRLQPLSADHGGAAGRRRRPSTSR